MELKIGTTVIESNVRYDKEILSIDIKNNGNIRKYKFPVSQILYNNSDLLLEYMLVNLEFMNDDLTKGG
jgi:hypothetical protein